MSIYNIPGQVGNPLVACSPKGPPLPVESEDECQIDSDCPSGRACLEHKCRNPCFELNPCASSAICSVVDTVPFRTMICSCREGWVPDTDRSCVPIETTNPPGAINLLIINKQIIVSLVSSLELN